MDADEGGIGNAVDEGHPILQVRYLFLPQGFRRGGVDGDVLRPGHHCRHPIKAHQLVQGPGNGQVDLALGLARGGDRAAVLSPVARVNDKGLLGQPGKGRLSSARPPKASRQQSHRHGRRQTAKENSFLSILFHSTSLPWQLYAAGEREIPQQMARATAKL